MSEPLRTPHDTLMMPVPSSPSFGGRLELLEPRLQSLVEKSLHFGDIGRDGITSEGLGLRRRDANALGVSVKVHSYPGDAVCIDAAQ